jgi:hypothetical protein
MRVRTAATVERKSGAAVRSSALLGGMVTLGFLAFALNGQRLATDPLHVPTP